MLMAKRTPGSLSPAVPRGKEYRLVIQRDAVISQDHRGTELARYRRHHSALEELHRHGLPTTLYEAGKRYAEIWTRAGCEPSIPHSDPTRIVVDGGGRPPDPDRGRADARRELAAIENYVGPWPSLLLVHVCGHDLSLSDTAWRLNPIWPNGLHRAKARLVLRLALSELREYWKRQERRRP